MANYRQEIENYLDYWNTIIGLLVIYFLFLSLYFSTLKELLLESFPTFSLFIVNLVIPFSVLLCIFLIWAFKSHRVGLFKKRKITIGLFFACDDFDKMMKIKKIVKLSIEEIENDFSDIRIKLYPINYIKTKSKLEKFISKSNHLIDNAIFAKIKYGNCLSDNETIEKIQVSDIIFSGKFDVNTNLKIFKSKISLINDLSIRNLNNNWDYIESKSFDDKDKIRHNLKDLILFYSGIYLIYMGNLDASLEIMKSLKISEDIKVDKFTIIKNSRLNIILLELFSFNALKEYLHKQNKEKAYKILKDCEILFKENHPYSFDHSITLARISYELGNIDDAYLYTGKAEIINKYSTAIYCNKGYFGIINNDVLQVVDNYKELAHTYRHKNKLNFVEILEFIDINKGKHPESKILIKFVIGALNFLYVDKVNGKQLLEEVEFEIKDDLVFIELKKFVEHLLLKGEYKSTYFLRDRKSKKQKKAS